MICLKGVQKKTKTTHKVRVIDSVKVVMKTPPEVLVAANMASVATVGDIPKLRFKDTLGSGKSGKQCGFR